MRNDVRFAYKFLQGRLSPDLSCKEVPGLSEDLADELDIL
jgi:hypothetical protein